MSSSVLRVNVIAFSSVFRIVLELKARLASSWNRKRSMQLNAACLSAAYSWGILDRFCTVSLIKNSFKDKLGMLTRRTFLTTPTAASATGLSWCKTYQRRQCGGSETYFCYWPSDVDNEPEIAGCNIKAAHASLYLCERCSCSLPAFRSDLDCL